MARFWKSDDLIFLMKVAGLGFLSILISKSLSLVPTEHWTYELAWFFGLLTKELGVALMIAAALGYTVEALAREKHQRELNNFKQEISENVLAAVFKKIVPDSIFEEIRRGVLEQTIVKRNSSLNYDLLEIPQDEQDALALEEAEKGSYLKCEITSRHELVNLADSPIKGHEIKAGVSCDLHSKLADHLKIHHVTIRNLDTGEEESYQDQSLEERIDAGEQQGFLLFKVLKELPARSKFEITVCSTTYKRIADTDVWTTLFPTENMSVTIRYPDSIKVSARSHHSKPLREETHNPKMNEKTYILEHGVFPHQGIAFWWRVA